VTVQIVILGLQLCLVGFLAWVAYRASVPHRADPDPDQLPFADAALDDEVELFRPRPGRARAVRQGERIVVKGDAVASVWVHTPDGWRRLVRRGGAFEAPFGALPEVQWVRLWGGDPDGPPLGEETLAAPMLTPWEAPPRVQLTPANIDAAPWTEAVQKAARAGLTGLPGAEEVAAHLGQPDQGARWLAQALGAAFRAAMVDRSSVERVELASRRVLDVARDLVDQGGGRARLVVDPPASVRSGQADWLLDRRLSEAFGNPVVNDAVQPLVVLRPAVWEEDVCVWAGEVA
jgi:hypothetical protein